MTSEGKRVKAMVLGGFAASAALGSGLCFVGVALLFVVPFYIGDHETGGPGVSVPTAIFALSAVSCLVAFRFGWRVGRDWYHSGL